jgi:(p)ppGpp synthase/HD superfamily hydrolase
MDNINSDKDWLCEAIKLAAEYHSTQKDLGGDYYILHPLRVMHKVEHIDEKIVAVMHDLIEDTKLTIDDIKNKGFNENICDALICLTKQKSEIYENYIKRISDNKIATIVKIADLEDNMNIMRLISPIHEKDFTRLSKYLEAWLFLNSFIRR